MTPKEHLLNHIKLRFSFVETTPAGRQLWRANDDSGLQIGLDHPPEGLRVHSQTPNNDGKKPEMFGMRSIFTHESLGPTSIAFTADGRVKEAYLDADCDGGPLDPQRTEQDILALTT